MRKKRVESAAGPPTSRPLVAASTRATLLYASSFVAAFVACGRQKQEVTRASSEEVPMVSPSKAAPLASASVSSSSSAAVADVEVVVPGPPPSAHVVIAKAPPPPPTPHVAPPHVPPKVMGIRAPTVP